MLSGVHGALLAGKCEAIWYHGFWCVMSVVSVVLAVIFCGCLWHESSLTPHLPAGMPVLMQSSGAEGSLPGVGQ